jgi:hypothetical protein
LDKVSRKSDDLANRARRDPSLAILRANEAPSPGPTPAITATSELKAFILEKIWAQ